LPSSANPQFSHVALLYFRHLQRLSSSTKLLTRVVCITPIGVCYVSDPTGKVKCSFHPSQVNSLEIRADDMSLLVRFRSILVSDLYLVFHQPLEREFANPAAATREYFVELLVRLSRDTIIVINEGENCETNSRTAENASKEGKKSSGIVSLARGFLGGGGKDETSVRKAKKQKVLKSSGLSFVTRVLRGLTALRDQQMLRRTASSPEPTADRRKLKATPHAMMKQGVAGIGSSSDLLEAYCIEVPATPMFPKGTFRDVLFFHRAVLMEEKVQQQHNSSITPRNKRHRGLLMLRQDGTLFFDTEWHAEQEGVNAASPDSSDGLLTVPELIAQAGTERLLEKLFLNMSQVTGAHLSSSASGSPALCIDYSMQSLRFPSFTEPQHPDEQSGSVTIIFDHVALSQMAPGDHFCCSPEYLLKIMHFLRPEIAPEVKNDSAQKAADEKLLLGSSPSVKRALRQARQSVEREMALRSLSKSQWLESEQCAAAAARLSAEDALRQATIRTRLSQLVFAACSQAIESLHQRQRDAMSHSLEALLGRGSGDGLLVRERPMDRIGLSEQRKKVASSLFHLL
jgi:hypothetical protein